MQVEFSTASYLFGRDNFFAIERQDVNVEMQVLSLWVQVLSQKMQVHLHVRCRSCILRLPDAVPNKQLHRNPFNLPLSMKKLSWLNKQLHLRNKQLHLRQKYLHLRKKQLHSKTKTCHPINQMCVSSRKKLSWIKKQLSSTRNAVIIVQTCHYFFKNDSYRCLLAFGLIASGLLHVFHNCTMLNMRNNIISGQRKSPPRFIIEVKVSEKSPSFTIHLPRFGTGGE